LNIREQSGWNTVAGDVCEHHSGLISAIKANEIDEVAADVS
jgi:hypothetical protein